MNMRTFLHVALSLLLFASCPIVAGDEPYRDYVVRRVSEGLSASSAESVAARMDGALIAALYANNVKREGAPEVFIQDASSSCLEWLETESEPWIRHFLVEALGELDADLNRTHLLELLDDTDPTVRARAAEYLPENLLDEEEARLIQKYAQEDLWWVKKQIVQALGGGRSDTSLTLLHRALDDPVPDVQGAASIALGQRGRPESIPYLIAALRRGNLIGSENPAWALGQIGSTAALDAPHERAFSPYPTERRAIATALGQIGSEASIPSLEILLEDPDALVRSRAFTALSEIGSSSAAVILLARLVAEPSEQGMESLLHIKPDALMEACSQFLEDRTTPDQNDQREELCHAVEDRMNNPRVTFFSTGELHSVFYSGANAKARTIAPEKGRKAIGWEDFIGKENGGTRYKLKRGLQVTIWKAAFYHGETWLEVTEGPYAANVWVREADLRRIDLSTLQDTSIYKNYGAESHFRLTDVKGDIVRSCG